jgi:CheY-like chemotaxis protein
MPQRPDVPRKTVVLIVDDLASTRELIGFVLQSEGFEVCYADSGRTALLVAEEKKPDVILLDVLMPGQDGYAVCAQIRQSPALQKKKVIVFSALNTHADRLRATQAGADEFLEKPVESEKLLAVLRRLLAA